MDKKPTYKEWIDGKVVLDTAIWPMLTNKLLPIVSHSDFTETDQGKIQAKQLTEFEINIKEVLQLHGLNLSQVITMLLQQFSQSYENKVKVTTNLVTQIKN